MAVQDGAAAASKRGVRRSIRLGLAGLVAVVTVVVLDTAGWWWLTGRTMAQITAWQDARRASGAVVATGPMARAGWPLWAEVVVPDVTIATASDHAIAWQSGRARFVLRLWDPDRVDILLEGQQALRLGSTAPIRLDADRLDIRLAVGSGVVTLAARGVRVPVEAGGMRAESVSLRLGPDDVQLAVAGLVVPDRALPFGGRIAWLELHARSSQPIPALRDLPAALAAWRDAGGRLTLDGLSLRWGKLDVGGHATLGLDAGMQPEGTGLLRLTGAGDAVDTLVRSGGLTRNEGRVAGTLLGLLSSPGPDGVPQADMPVTLRNRVVSVGSNPLLRVPALTLP